MPVDQDRLNRERRELKNVFGDRARSFRFSDTDASRWETYGADLTYGRYTIRATYPSDYPSRPHRITVNPPPQSRHYYDHDGSGPTLCWLYQTEWSPGWTLTTALMVATRFLRHLDQHLTD